MGIIEQFSLKGKTALVTGSSRGIGKAIAGLFVEAGARVVIHGVGDAERLRRAQADTGAAAMVWGNLGHTVAVKALYQSAVDAVGFLDILVCNASLQIKKAWEEISADEFDQQMSTNVRSTLCLAQLVAPSMAERGWGRILTIGSVQQSVPHPEMLAYAASKAAQTNMVRNLAKQLAPKGITVNNLAPGVIETDRNIDALSDKKYAAQVSSKIPSGCLGRPEDCAGAALMLCSPGGNYITGQDLYVDGGMSL